MGKNLGCWEDQRILLVGGSQDLPWEHHRGNVCKMHPRSQDGVWVGFAEVHRLARILLKNLDSSTLPSGEETEAQGRQRKVSRSSPEIH